MKNLFQIVTNRSFSVIVRREIPVAKMYVFFLNLIILELQNYSGKDQRGQVPVLWGRRFRLGVRLCKMNLFKIFLSFRASAKDWKEQTSEILRSDVYAKLQCTKQGWIVGFILKKIKIIRKMQGDDKTILDFAKYPQNDITVNCRSSKIGYCWTNIITMFFRMLAKVCQLLHRWMSNGEIKRVFACAEIIIWEIERRDEMPERWHFIRQ